MSRIDDGFGDDLSIEEVIISNERLLMKRAAERINSPQDWDDILQEGRIVQWQVLSKRPESAPSYVSAAMAYRVTNAATQRSWFGSEAKHGHPIDPIRRTDRDSFDNPDFHDVATASDTIDKIIFAYHHGEIAEALSALTQRQREYVYYRFWEGLSTPEIAAKQERTSKAVDSEWRNTTRPKLLKKLEHLQELIT